MRAHQTVRVAACVGLSSLLIGSTPGGGVEEHGVPIELHLDHANVAVADLEGAGRVLERMGFVLKPGRPHANSIANLHAKFGDGTELELITATEPRDELAAEYLEWIEQGDGGAFCALRCPRLEGVVAALGARGVPHDVSAHPGYRYLTFPRGESLRPIFLVGVAQPWIDRAEYLEHPNTAQRLRAVWFKPSSAAPLLELAEALGFEPSTGKPPTAASTVVPLSSGELVVSQHEPSGPPRAVVGVTIEVTSLDEVLSFLEPAGISHRLGSDDRGTTVMVAPEDLPCFGLEFLDPLPPSK